MPADRAARACGGLDAELSASHGSDRTRNWRARSVTDDAGRYVLALDARPTRSLNSNTPPRLPATACRLSRTRRPRRGRHRRRRRAFQAGSPAGFRRLGSSQALRSLRHLSLFEPPLADSSTGSLAVMWAAGPVVKLVHRRKRAGHRRAGPHNGGKAREGRIIDAGTDARVAAALPQDMDHAGRQHGSREIVSRSVEGPIVRTTYGALRSRSLHGGAAARACRLGLGDRIATLAWNTARHMGCGTAPLASAPSTTR